VKTLMPLHRVSYAPEWIKVDPGSTILGSSKLLIKIRKNEICYEIEGAKMR